MDRHRGRDLDGFAGNARGRDTDWRETELESGFAGGYGYDRAHDRDSAMRDLDRDARDRKRSSAGDAREGDADQWVAGGTLPDLDETWGIPADDPDATVPLRR